LAVQGLKGGRIVMSREKKEVTMATMTRRLVTALTAGMLALGAAGLALAADSVTLRLDWVMGSEQSPIFLAKEKGFFKAEGIDVQILPGEGSTVTVKLVGNKSNDFGLATADQTLMAHAKGLPVISTAVIAQKSPGGIIFPKDKPIRKLEELYGKRLGTQIKGVVHKHWEAVARLHNLDRTRITELPFDRAIAQAIAGGKIDAGVAFFFNDGLLLEAKGTPMGALMFSDLGLEMYSTSLIVHQDMLKEKPDLVRRFTRAFIRGWTYSKANPDEALGIFLKANPNIDPVYARLKLPAVLALTESEDTRKNGFGYSTKAGWEGMQKALISMQLMEAPIDVARVFTNDFLAK
jgi:NitT/TauT family transport system substrate-binding protein